jgi:transposase InsO family protein
VLSRYAWVVPLKDKTGKTLKDVFQVIFKSGRRPIRLQTDKGTEFTNQVFQKFLKEHDVHFFTTYNEETKASIVERLNRTLKTKMWKYFTHRETLTYVDVLSEMVGIFFPKATQYDVLSVSLSAICKTDTSNRDASLL